MKIDLKKWQKLKFEKKKKVLRLGEFLKFFSSAPCFAFIEFLEAVFYQPVIFVAGRLHLGHPQLQEQGGRDQEDQQGVGQHQVHFTMKANVGKDQVSAPTFVKFRWRALMLTEEDLLVLNLVLA